MQHEINYDIRLRKFAVDWGYQFDEHMYAWHWFLTGAGDFPGTNNTLR